MKNGFVQIEGSRRFLGGALPGNKQGMKGGAVLVKGNVGARAGDHMRRGQILIEGNAGDYCGSRMLAGTIAVMGKTGRYPAMPCAAEPYYCGISPKYQRPSMIAAPILWHFCPCCLRPSNHSTPVLQTKILPFNESDDLAAIWPKQVEVKF